MGDLFIDIREEKVDLGQPVVSVIILTYNQEKTVGRAIESVLSQKTNFAFEIVIGEDGSTDRTREICEDYARKYPEVITLLPKAPNKGVVRNYFDAFRATRGVYIADCAGDDRWSDETKLQNQRDFMNHNTDVAIYFTSWTNVDLEGHPVDYGYSAREYWEGLTDGRQMLESFLAHQLPIVLSTALYRRSLLVQALEEAPEMVENEEMGCEDLPVCAALLSRGLGASSTRRTLDYTVGNPASITAASDLRRRFDFHLCALRGTVLLARYYDVAMERLAPHVREQVRYLLSLAWKLHDRELGDKVRELVNTFHLPCDWKSRVLMAVWRKSKK